jgi:hypothetical protein
VKVYLLWHMRPLQGQDELDTEQDHIETEDKLCGVFSSEARAKEARQQLLGQPGFCDYPDDFLVDEYEVDATTWTEGFVTE